MRAVVIGAGVAGVTVAWELCQSGYTVTVLDRQPEPAAETSHANAGLIAAGHEPWASPKVPAILFKSLFVGNQAYRLKPRLDWQMMRWGLRFLRQCTNRRATENAIHAYQLCRYAQSRLHHVTKQTGIEYDSQRRGLLYVFRSESTLREGVEYKQIIKDMGHEIQVLSAGEVVEKEPAFAGAAGQIAGAVYCPTDESGDSRQFTLRLAEACRKQGAQFVFDCAVERIVVGHSRIRCLNTTRGDYDADVYVVASGAEAPWLTRPIGIDLPIYPVKGYSVTFPATKDHHAPLIGGVDEDRWIAFSRMGDRLRVTSTVEVCGYDSSYRPSDFDHMIQVFSALMPEAADYSRPEYWSCLRPMTPNGRPVIGSTRYDNLYLNVGHGNLGWTMACGTARLVADIIEGRDTEISVTAMTLH